MYPLLDAVYLTRKTAIGARALRIAKLTQAVQRALSRTPAAQALPGLVKSPVPVKELAKRIAGRRSRQGLFASTPEYHTNKFVQDTANPIRRQAQRLANNLPVAARRELLDTLNSINLRKTFHNTAGETAEKGFTRRSRLSRSLLNKVNKRLSEVIPAGYSEPGLLTRVLKTVQRAPVQTNRGVTDSWATWTRNPEKIFEAAKKGQPISEKQHAIASSFITPYNERIISKTQPLLDRVRRYIGHKEGHSDALHRYESPITYPQQLGELTKHMPNPRFKGTSLEKVRDIKPQDAVWYTGRTDVPLHYSRIQSSNDVIAMIDESALKKFGPVGPLTPHLATDTRVLSPQDLQKVKSRTKHDWDAAADYEQVATMPDFKTWINSHVFAKPSQNSPETLRTLKPRAFGIKYANP